LCSEVESLSSASWRFSSLDGGAAAMNAATTPSTEASVEADQLDPASQPSAPPSLDVSVDRITRLVLKSLSKFNTDSPTLAAALRHFMHRTTIHIHHGRRRYSDNMPLSSRYIPQSTERPSPSAGALPLISSAAPYPLSPPGHPFPALETLEVLCCRRRRRRRRRCRRNPDGVVVRTQLRARIAASSSAACGARAPRAVAAAAAAVRCGVQAV
jgi:hypothetical protein